MTEPSNATDRVVVFGNSGAGKSTLAAHLARQHGLEHLDLDTLAWASADPPTRRPTEESAVDIRRFMAEHSGWVIEGCYADLLSIAAEQGTRLIFLNPGIDACVANCRARPFEPHKYATPEEQDANLDALIDWVREYERRDDEFSLTAHRRLFDGFSGDKTEHLENVTLTEARDP